MKVFKKMLALLVLAFFVNNSVDGMRFFRARGPQSFARSIGESIGTQQPSSSNYQEVKRVFSQAIQGIISISYDAQDRLQRLEQLFQLARTNASAMKQTGQTATEREAWFKEPVTFIDTLNAVMRASFSRSGDDVNAKAAALNTAIVLYIRNFGPGGNFENFPGASNLINGWASITAGITFDIIESQDSLEVKTQKYTSLIIPIFELLISAGSSEASKEKESTDNTIRYLTTIDGYVKAVSEMFGEKRLQAYPKALENARSLNRIIEERQQKNLPMGDNFQSPFFIKPVEFVEKTAELMRIVDAIYNAFRAQPQNINKAITDLQSANNIFKNFFAEGKSLADPTMLQNLAAWLEPALKQVSEILITNREFDQYSNKIAPIYQTLGQFLKDDLEANDARVAASLAGQQSQPQPQLPPQPSAPDRPNLSKIPNLQEYTGAKTSFFNLLRNIAAYDYIPKNVKAIERDINQALEEARIMESSDIIANERENYLKRPSLYLNDLYQVLLSFIHLRDSADPIATISDLSQWYVYIVTTYVGDSFILPAFEKQIFTDLKYEEIQIMIDQNKQYADKRDIFENRIAPIYDTFNAYGKSGQASEAKKLMEARLKALTAQKELIDKLNYALSLEELAQNKIPLFRDALKLADIVQKDFSIYLDTSSRSWLLFPVKTVEALIAFYEHIASVQEALNVDNAKGVINKLASAKDLFLTYFAQDKVFPIDFSPFLILYIDLVAKNLIANAYYNIYIDNVVPIYRGLGKQAEDSLQKNNQRIAEMALQGKIVDISSVTGDNLKKELALAKSQPTKWLAPSPLPDSDFRSFVAPPLLPNESQESLQYRAALMKLFYAQNIKQLEELRLDAEKKGQKLLSISKDAWFMNPVRYANKLVDLIFSSFKVFEDPDFYFAKREPLVHMSRDQSIGYIIGDLFVRCVFEYNEEFAAGKSFNNQQFPEFNELLKKKIVEALDRASNIFFASDNITKKEAQLYLDDLDVLYRKMDAMNGPTAVTHRGEAERLGAIVKHEIWTKEQIEENIVRNLTSLNFNSVNDIKVFVTFCAKTLPDMILKHISVSVQPMIWIFVDSIVSEIYHSKIYPISGNELKLNLLAMPKAEVVSFIEFLHANKYALANLTSVQFSIDALSKKLDRLPLLIDLLKAIDEFNPNSLDEIVQGSKELARKSGLMKEELSKSDYARARRQTQAGTTEEAKVVVSPDFRIHYRNTEARNLWFAFDNKALNKATTKILQALELLYKAKIRRASEIISTRLMLLPELNTIFEVQDLGGVKKIYNKILEIPDIFMDHRIKIDPTTMFYEWIRVLAFDISVLFSSAFRYTILTDERRKEVFEAIKDLNQRRGFSSLNILNVSPLPSSDFIPPSDK